MIVLIRLEGGTVQSAGLPPGITLEVRDYDIEGLADEELHTDSEGQKCYVTIFNPEDGYTLDNWPTRN